MISELPFSKTTTDLIDSVLKANEKGKIKIKKIEDNTSDKVEILVYLHNEVSPDKTIDALYAFTDCQVTISPNACVIVGDKPMFLNVSEILRMNTDHTVSLLKKNWKSNFMNYKKTGIFHHWKEFLSRTEFTTILKR